MSRRGDQLTIPLKLEALNRFDNFHPGRNLEAVTSLQTLAGNASEVGYWLWGERGRGRSHLLQAACQAAGAAGRRALYLPLSLLPRNPMILENLHAHLVALDDVDTWLGDRSLESEIMSLYQAALANGSHLVVSAACSAQQASFTLADFGSRMRALTSYEILPPDDEGLRGIIGDAARQRGLSLTRNVLDYWLNRSVRELIVLLEELERLDARALTEQRRITIPLIKEVLAR